MTIIKQNFLTNFLKKDYIPNCSLFLLYFLANSVFVTSILFFLGVSISYVNLFLSLLLSSFLLYLHSSSLRYTFAITCISIILLIIFSYISMAVFDHTWDGAAYHKQAIGFLKEGWNPVYQSASDFNSLSHSIQWPRNNPIFWAETYPKATWYFSSILYYAFNNIEVGKSYNLVIAFVLFGLVFDYCSKCHFKKFKSVCISILATLNPILLAQFQSFYLDGMASCVLVALIIVFIISEKEQTIHYSKIFCLIILGCNLKFSITLFTGLECIVYFLYKLCTKKRNIENLKLFCFFVLSALVSILLVGFAPYMTNYFRYGNMLYGFFINGSSLAETNENFYFGISELNNAQMFLSSLFGKMSHGTVSNLYELLKFPFTINKDEIFYYNYPDTKFGGFGVLFSGIFLIAITIVIIHTYQKYRINELDEESQLSFIFILLIVIECLIFPSTFIARYVGHLYFVVIASIFILFRNTGKKNAFSFLFSFLILANLLPWLSVSIKNTNTSIQTRNTLAYLSNNDFSSEELEINFRSDDFTGMHYNLKDFGIHYNYIYIDELVEEDTYISTYGDWMHYKICTHFE